MDLLTRLKGKAMVVPWAEKTKTRQVPEVTTRHNIRKGAKNVFGVLEKDNLLRKPE